MLKIEICNIVTKTISKKDYTFDTDISDWFDFRMPDTMLFIDPSTTSLGMSIAYLPKKAPVYGIGVKRSSGSKENFVEEYGDFLNKLLKIFPMKNMLVENQYIDRRKVEAYAALKMVMGKISFVSKRNNVKMHKILPTVWKGPVLDLYGGMIDKRKSNKKEIRQVMTRMIPQTLSISTMDVFDSLGMMYYYVTYMLVDDSGNRKDLITMMYCLADGMDFQEYEGIVNSSNEPFNETPRIKEFNDFFYDKCDGKIVKITKNSTKEYRKHFRVEITKLRIKNQKEFFEKIEKEIRTIKLSDIRGVDYVIHDTESSITDNAMGYMGLQKNRIGVMIMKPNRQILSELFQGRKMLGKISKNDYIFVCVRI